MKKVLIAGAGGMAGHMIYKYLRETGKYELGATVRNQVEGIEALTIDIEEDPSMFSEIVSVAEPDFIINCIGLLVKASQESPAEAIYINSFFPHLLESITAGTKTRVIHLSTDCVFNGQLPEDMMYSESDMTTETNWYGRTKAMGELINDKDLTVRMSIIGPELKDGTGLFHWFMKQEGTVRGFAGHHWNGITTLELATQLDRIMDTDLKGLFHLVPATRITKYDLLCLMNKIFEKNLTVEKVDDGTVNKVLTNNRYKDFEPDIPSYEQQMLYLKAWMMKK